jgi:hypothetical protein
MISNDDPRWSSVTGGYRLTYDPRAALHRLRANCRDADAWTELWDNLHHQGDLGDASYASVVVLAGMLETTDLPREDLFHLVATIEVERHRRTNPPLPEWLRSEYKQAWRVLLNAAIRELQSGADATLVQSAIVVVLLAKGLNELGAVVWYHDQDTVRDYLDTYLAWTELYSTKVE